MIQVVLVKEFPDEFLEFHSELPIFLPKPESIHLLLVFIGLLANQHLYSLEV